MAKHISSNVTTSVSIEADVHRAVRTVADREYRGNFSLALCRLAHEGLAVRGVKLERKPVNASRERTAVAGTLDGVVGNAGGEA